ncbi:MAG: ABC transporter ATP-binding protein [Thomasclavelia sp.]|uniref:ABC transporter ATP-binding protein n=1 Tax=Thomasclavelia sp. TaxID=3025757 RepID=UPI00399FB64A
MIEFENVSKIYQNGNKKIYALNKVSFTINSGEFVVILGPSGAGKSTLLNILGGIDRLDEGKIIIDNIIISNKNENELSNFRAKQVGFIFQFYNLIPTLTVYENVALMKELKKDIMPVDDILDKVGLLEHKKKFPHQLSGGEQQRVSIARAVTKNPNILLCDEPTGALDSDTGAKVLKLLYDMCKEYHKTTIIVTHNANLQAIGDKVIRVKNGQINSITINEHPLDVMEVEW